MSENSNPSNVNIIDFEAHKIKKLEKELDDMTMLCLNMYSCFDYMFLVAKEINDPIVQALLREKPDNPEAITAVVSLVVKYLDKRGLPEV